MRAEGVGWGGGGAGRVPGRLGPELLAEFREAVEEGQRTGLLDRRSMV